MRETIVCILTLLFKLSHGRFAINMCKVFSAACMIGGMASLLMVDWAHWETSLGAFLCLEIAGATLAVMGLLLEGELND